MREESVKPDTASSRSAPNVGRVRMCIRLIADHHTACQAGGSSAEHVARQRILFGCPASVPAMASVCFCARESQGSVWIWASEMMSGGSCIHSSHLPSSLRRISSSVDTMWGSAAEMSAKRALAWPACFEEDAMACTIFLPMHIWL